jgi:glycerophosphoryl diester phosphodiesterase
MLDRRAFIRPYAHRGLHNSKLGIIENSPMAFLAGLEKGYGIECDLQAAVDGTPMVFHDETVDRLMQTTGRVDTMTPAALRTLTYKQSKDRVISYAEFLELAAGRGPLLVEIKSEWVPPRAGFLESIATLSKAYKGPLALMSFDPVIMARLAELAPTVPRGIVAGRYEGDGWWLDVLGPERGRRLTDLLESGPAQVSFYSYHVKALPTPVTRYVREVQGLPVFCWTVRTPDDRAVAAQWSDAPTFEGFEP